MSTGMTPDEWAESRCDWLVDVGLIQNGYGTYDVVARVDGAYADLESARHFLARHRGEIAAMVRRLRREKGWARDAAGTAWPFAGDPEAVATVMEPESDVYAAVEVLAQCRHQLPSDILRSLQSIWFCASAARFGGPYEDFAMEPEAYAEHNTGECEDEAHSERGPGAMIERFCDETERSTPYTCNFDPAADTEEFLAWIAEQPMGRAAKWSGIRRRYGRNDHELIAGALKLNPALGVFDAA